MPRSVRPRSEAALTVTAAMASAGVSRHARTASAMANGIGDDGAGPGLALGARARRAAVGMKTGHRQNDAERARLGEQGEVGVGRGFEVIDAARAEPHRLCD